MVSVQVFGFATALVAENLYFLLMMVLAFMRYWINAEKK